jgi:hypothetical protein
VMKPYASMKLDSYAQMIIGQLRVRPKL